MTTTPTPYVLTLARNHYQLSRAFVRECLYEIAANRSLFRAYDPELEARYMAAKDEEDKADKILTWLHNLNERGELCE